MFNSSYIWFYMKIPRHYLTETLLKVALNTITLKANIHLKFSVLLRKIAKTTA